MLHVSFLFFFFYFFIFDSLALLFFSVFVFVCFFGEQGEECTRYEAYIEEEREDWDKGEEKGA